MRKQHLYIVAVLVALPLHSAWGQAAAREVSLVAGTCPAVQDGDVVTLDWNPAFAASSTAALDDLRLHFIQPVQDRKTRTGAVLSLRLRPAKSTLPVAEPLQDIHNGYYHMRFRVKSSDLPAGEYRLGSAEAVAKMPPGFTGDAPILLNDPSHSAFCLTVTEPAKERTKGKFARAN